MSSSQVEETNSFCTLSKRSMIEKGYSRDKFITCFTSKKVSRAPLINMGYYIRTKIINYIVEKFVALHKLKHAQIISFGAGFDTLYFRLFDNNLISDNFQYYEIDLEDVVTQKLNFFQSNSLIKDAIGKAYHLINANLDNLEEFESSLTKHKIDFSIPTLILAECSIIYMKASSSNALIEWSSKTFPNAAMVVYEQVFPNTAFGQIMTNHFSKLNTPLRSITENLTLSQIRYRYINAGWENCFVHTKWNVFKSITTVTERLEAFSKELFDEWEEIYMLCAHYSLALARQGTLNDIPLLPKIALENEQEHSSLNYIELHSSEILQRFGHSSCEIGSETIFISGGFSCERSRHERSKTAYLLRNDNWQKISMPSTCALMHSISIFNQQDQTIYILGGRQSPAKASSNIYKFPLKSLPNGDFQSNECLKLSRWRHSALIVSIESNFGFFIYGGITVGLKILDDCFFLPFDNTGETIELAKGPGPRFSQSAILRECFSRKSVYLFGGLNSELEPKNDLWQYDILNNEWIRLNINGPQPVARHGHKSLITNHSQKLVLVGGANCEAGIRQPGITIIDLNNLTCIEYTLTPNCETSTHPLLLLNFSICLRSSIDFNKIKENDVEICIIAGGANCFSFGTHFNKTILSFHVPNIENK